MTPVYKIKIPGSTDTLWAKFENRNPTGTHKDRSLGPWILHYAKQGAKELAISSSGNSAISAAKYCDENSIKLHAFVSPSVEKEKVRQLTTYRNVVVNITKTPMRDTLQFCKRSGVANLRASTDDNALFGYKDIACELMEQLPHIDTIFVPTSSGATLEGIYLGYTCSSHIPSFYAVQTTKVHPIASYFDKDFVDEKTSYATAIVDNIAHRRDRVIEIIKETGGGGFVISNSELEKAQEIFERNEAEFALGWQSLLSFAGFLKWKKQSISPADAVSVCICTD